MLSQGVIEKAEHMGDKLGVGSSQPRLHFGNNDTALLDVLKGDSIKWFCNPQCVLVPRVAEVIPVPFLAILRSPSESRCRHAWSRVGLNCRF